MEFNCNKDPDDNYALTDIQMYNIKSSLINYDILTTFTPSYNFVARDADPPVELKISQSFTEHMNTLYKLHNQIINGNYLFEIYAPTSPYIEFTMNIAIQLEFIEYN